MQRAQTFDDDIFREPAWMALIFLVVAAATILGALGFEHIGGYQPCPLCLMQRTPYYVGVPLAAATAIAAWMGASRTILVALFGLLCTLMLYSFGLAVYHAGVEWKLWQGPASCAPSVAVQSAADMLNQLQTARAPSCTEAVWRFLGLSFAGWNAIVSAALAALAFYAALAALRRPEPYGSRTASQ